MLHTLLKLYNAPAGAEFDLLKGFAATFASTILTFFIGVLLFHYQVSVILNLLRCTGSISLRLLG